MVAPESVIASSFPNVMLMHWIGTVGSVSSSELSSKDDIEAVDAVASSELDFFGVQLLVTSILSSLASLFGYRILLLTVGVGL